MNGAHWHLAINHVPVIGMIGAALLLAYAVVHRGTELRRLALAVTLLAGLSAVPVFLTGDGAEETIEHLPGVEEKRIDEHQDAAKWGLGLCLAAGVVAIGALIVTRGRPVPRGPVGVTLAVSLVACLALLRVANLGGEIRHPEIRSGFTAPTDRGGGEARAGGERGEHGEAGERGEHDGD